MSVEEEKRVCKISFSLIGQIFLTIWQNPRIGKFCEIADYLTVILDMNIWVRYSSPPPPSLRTSRFTQVHSIIFDLYYLLLITKCQILLQICFHIIMSPLPLGPTSLFLLMLLSPSLYPPSSLSSLSLSLSLSLSDTHTHTLFPTPPVNDVHIQCIYLHVIMW